MASKSAHIDATLRLAGLSEVFTQDLEDMKNLERLGGEPAGEKPAATPPPENLREFADGECDCGSPLLKRTSKAGKKFVTCMLYYDATYGGDEGAKATLEQMHAAHPELVGKHYYKPEGKRK